MSGNEYVSELRAERDRLREVVARAIEQAWESLPDLALASECSPILANVVLDVITTPQAVVGRAPCPICGSPNTLHSGEAHALDPT